MNSQTRMVLVLGAFGFGATIVLMAMANRYVKILEKRAEDGPRTPSVVGAGRHPGSAAVVGGGLSGGSSRVETLDEAVRRVDAFIEVRRALSNALEQSASASPDHDVVDLTALRQLRDDAARRAGMAPADYLEVRAFYREWKHARRSFAQHAMFTALDLRRAQLEPLDLGRHEDADL